MHANKFFQIKTLSNFEGINAQGKGLMYSNIIDCFIKTLRVEGFWALYKGFSANYMRIAPHTMLNLVIWEQFKRWKDLYYESVVYFEWNVNKRRNMFVFIIYWKLNLFDYIEHSSGIFKFFSQTFFHKNCVSVSQTLIANFSVKQSKQVMQPASKFQPSYFINEDQDKKWWKLCKTNPR